MREVVVARHPFADLIRLEKAAPPCGPPMLLASPLSGHRPILLRDLALGLLAETDVHFVAWKDASAVSLEAGRFGLAENIDHLLAFIRMLGPETHVLGLSQSPLPSLAAIALLAEGFGTAVEPASLTLMSGFLDPRINPTRVGRLLSAMPGVWFERCGIGRMVYPAAVQRCGLWLYLIRHLTTGNELWWKTFCDDGDPGGPSFLDLFFAVHDLPAELVGEMVAAAFHDHVLPRGRLFWRGLKVRPEAISRCGLMTVEGGLDDVSGIGQTMIAHQLCRNVPRTRRAHHLEAGIGHFGGFHGYAWRNHIRPRLCAFIRQCRGNHLTP